MEYIVQLNITAWLKIVIRDAYSLTAWMSVLIGKNSVANMHAVMKYTSIGHDRIAQALHLPAGFDLHV